MTWDFAEANLFGLRREASSRSLELGGKGARATPAIDLAGQHRSTPPSYRHAPDLTDPPYYDNIGYSDLSDFFYVWLRRSLRVMSTRDLLATLLVPKAEELVANPYRHDGKDGARDSSKGLSRCLRPGARIALADYPIAVYYAFKQPERDGGSVDRLGDAARRNDPVGLGDHRHLADAKRARQPHARRAPTRWPRRSSWPCVRARCRAESPIGAASSPPSRPSCRCLTELQQGAIAPVDLPQAAIGPGMAVFSRYAEVIETDGSRCRCAGAPLINEALDEVLSEQEATSTPTPGFVSSGTSNSAASREIRPRR